MRRRIFKTKQLLLTAILLITTTTAVQADFMVNIYINESNRINLTFNSPAQIPFSANLVIAEQFDQYQTSSGYTFAGWYKSDNTSWPVDSTVSEATDIYARWNTVVTFDSKGGSAISPSTSQCRTDLPITMPGDPTFPGFNFDGWYYTDDVNSVKKWDLTKNITAQYARAKIDLYAHWNPVIVLNTSIPAGLTSNMPTDNDTIITYNGTFDFILTPASGRHFRVAVNGNYITESGGVFTYTFNNVTAPDTIRTITADEYFLVGYNSQGGTPVTRTDSITASATIPSSPVTTRTEYTFGGWWTAISGVSGATEWSFGGSGTSVTQDTTLYAHWIAHTTVITGQPAGDELCIGSGYTISVAATGTSLTYQWYKDGVAIPGATSDSYDITNAQPSHSGSYTVIVTGLAGSPVTSNEAIIKVLVTTEIVTNIADATFSATPGTLKIEAVGNNLTYQWYHNNQAIPGAISERITMRDDGYYYVTVTGGCGTVNSNRAYVYFDLPTPVINRMVSMPQIQGIATSPYAGKHYVPSGGSFVFEMWPLPGYSLRYATVTTDRGNDVVIELAEPVIATKSLVSVPSFTGDERLRVTVKNVYSAITIRIEGAGPVGNDFGLQNGELTAYPNPTDGIITIKGLTTGKTIYIYNMSGTLVSTLIANDETQKIDLSALAKGTYLLQFEGQTIKIIRK